MEQKVAQAKLAATEKRLTGIKEETKVRHIRDVIKRYKWKWEADSKTKG